MSVEDNKEIVRGYFAEEWVCRDELGMLVELGVISPQE